MQFKARLAGPGPWGFRLTGGKENDQPLIISRLTAGGKAAKADILKDDILTGINGEPTSDMTLARAQEKIRQVRGDLYLALFRRGGGPTSPQVRQPEPTRAAQPQYHHAYHPPETATPAPPPPPPPPTQFKAYQAPMGPRSPRSPEYQDNFTRQPQPFAHHTPPAKSSSTYKPVASPKIMQMGATKDKKPFTYGYDPSSVRSPGNRPVSPPRHNEPRVEIRKEPQYQPHHQPVKMPSYYRRIDPTHGAEEPESELPTSPQARVVHLQYNSPVGIYSSDNIADTFRGQTADLIASGQAGVIGSGGHDYADHGAQAYKPVQARSSQPHYGGTSPQPHYGGTSPQPHYGATSPRPHYGGTSPQPHYGATSPQPHYGTTSPKPHYGGTSPSHTDNRAAPTNYHGYHNPGSQSRSFRVLEQIVQESDEYGQEL